MQSGINRSPIVGYLLFSGFIMIVNILSSVFLSAESLWLIILLK